MGGHKLLDEIRDLSKSFGMVLQEKPAAWKRQGLRLELWNAYALDKREAIPSYEELLFWREVITEASEEQYNTSWQWQKIWDTAHDMKSGTTWRDKRRRHSTRGARELGEATLQKFSCYNNTTHIILQPWF